MEDYRITELTNLINEVVNPIHSKNERLMLRYLRLHGSVYYFEYAVGAVRAQEWGLSSKQADALIVGSAVSSYMHMDSCLRLFDYALQSISNKQIRFLNKKYKKLKKDIKNIRDRFAHPEEDRKKGIDKKFYIMSKRQMICSDGRVAVRQVAIKLPHEGVKIILSPRKDLEKLRKYLTGISLAAKDEFKKL